MIDSHTHLGVCEPPDEDLVSAAAQAGVVRMLTVGMDEDSNPAAVEKAESFDSVYAAVGRHPNKAEGYDDGAAAAIERLAAHPKVRAIGETGLDYFRDGAPREDQRRAFASQIGIAQRTGLPLVIHARSGEGPDRDALGECLDTLASEADGTDVILHCFSGDESHAEIAAERGWYCSFAGNLTYPKAEGLRRAAAVVPEELLLVETDAPFLTPQPMRKERNQPAFVVETARVLAEVRSCEYADLERVVEDNAARVFGW